jgi:hypothetical protein
MNLIIVLFMELPLAVWKWQQLLPRSTAFSLFSDLIAQRWQKQDYQSAQIGFDI